MNVRRLNRHDAFRYKYFRLSALKNEPELAGYSYASENSLPFSHWTDETKETPDKCMFGLFDELRLVATLMAKRWEDDKSGETAYLGYAYKRPKNRGDGESKPLYLLREDWIIKNGFKRVVFNFGLQNKRSMKMHIKRGAKYTHKEKVARPNGSTEIWYWFKKDLPPRPLPSLAQPAQTRKAAVA